MTTWRTIKIYGALLSLCFALVSGLKAQTPTGSEQNSEKVIFVSADQVAVRSGPGTEYSVLKRLQRGDTVALHPNLPWQRMKDAAARAAVNAAYLAQPAAQAAAIAAAAATPTGGNIATPMPLNQPSADSANFCRITKPIEGFIACQYLSDQALPLIAATTPSAQGSTVSATAPNTLRYANGKNVNFRDAPTMKSKIIATLEINTPLQLLSQPPEAGFCAVRLKEQSGYVACQFMSEKEVDLNSEKYQAKEIEESLRVTAKQFSNAPSYWDFLTYLGHLERKYTAKDQGFSLPAPRLATADQMKARLQEGFVPTTNDYQSLRTMADQLFRDASSYKGENNEQNYADYLKLLPAIEPRRSAFQSSIEIQVRNHHVELLSYRFSIPMQWRFEPRKKAKEGHYVLGVWDLHAKTESLKESIWEHALYSDGKIVSKRSIAEVRTLISNPNLDEMCPGFEVGFTLGEPDEIFSITADEKGKLKRPLSRNPTPIRLISFFSKSDQSFSASKPIKIKTNSPDLEGAGFDLNSDGLPDIVLFKRTSKTPDDTLHGNEKPEPWERTFFANVAGKWVLFAQDTYEYGCGC